MCYTLFVLVSTYQKLRARERKALFVIYSPICTTTTVLVHVMCIQTTMCNIIFNWFSMNLFVLNDRSRSFNGNTFNWNNSIKKKRHFVQFKICISIEWIRNLQFSFRKFMKMIFLSLCLQFASIWTLFFIGDVKTEASILNAGKKEACNSISSVCCIEHLFIHFFFWTFF